MMKKLTFSICGTGCRGESLTRNVIAELPDVEILAVCDVCADKAETLADRLAEMTGLRPLIFTDHGEMFANCKTDAVYVATDWETHIGIAIDAMRQGIAVAMEVGRAFDEAECRSLVSAWEETHTPFMMMENCCFGKEELFATSLARNGVLGTVVYCHGAYAHDLRSEVAYGDINRHYRLKQYSTHNCENYPTHELGPIARLLNVTRGNRFVSLVSRASRSCGLHEYVQDKPELDYLKDREFAQGDIVETLITCENGELINIRLDTTLPRYYSREMTVRGTGGMYDQNCNMVIRERGDKHEEWKSVKAVRAHLDNAGEYYDDYLPKLWKDVEAEKLKKGHGGIDYLEFVAFVDALRNGDEMPIDVYDAATWLAVGYLSEMSIKLGGASVEFPDFTNGAYKTREPKDVTEIPVVKK